MYEHRLKRWPNTSAELTSVLQAELLRPQEELSAVGLTALWPWVRLLAEIGLEVGSQYSHLGALNRLQAFCNCVQFVLDETLDAIDAVSQRMVWYKPGTWVGGWTKGEDVKVLPTCTFYA